MNATISRCGLYRYSLDRAWGHGKTITFIGVNPSTADASIDDATVRRWRGFSERWGFASFTVVNLFAFRSTDVGALASAQDAIGPENDRYIRAAIGAADLVVPCWGDRGKLPRALRPRIDAVRELLRTGTAPVQVFGLTAGGDPKHPLMLSYATERKDWVP